MNRENYEMTAEDLQELLNAIKPVPMIALQCGNPPSPQENANAAWARLGNKMGFKHMTVEPTGQGPRYFSAEPVRCRGIEIEDGVFSGCDATGGDCPSCGL
jgi:hypothetical protein